jgi:1-phosphofructokinase family hexose kinase
MSHAPFITVGICPAWDVICRADSVDWGQHVRVSQTAIPAGKALNVSRALAWLGQTSIAAGLWGQSDWPAAEASLAAFRGRIDCRMTLAPGQTRQNITVIDTRGRREMHLRAACPLASKASLAQLAGDLKSMVTPASRVVFSGSMPEGGLLEDCLAMIRNLCRSGARVAADSSGPALSRAVELGGLALIKPNLEELCQLLGRTIPNDPSAIREAARTFCDRTQMILVSRGADGAMVITKDRAFACRARVPQDKVVNTVGCGDYLLAGFLAGEDTADLYARLETAVKVATAHALGLTESMDWPTAAVHIRIEAVRM